NRSIGTLGDSPQIGIRQLLSNFFEGLGGTMLYPRLARPAPALDVSQVLRDVLNEGQVLCAALEQVSHDGTRSFPVLNAQCVAYIACVRRMVGIEHDCGP